jgi:hypothetical protein
LVLKRDPAALENRSQNGLCSQSNSVLNSVLNEFSFKIQNPLSNL